jgi:hypothetical protein
MTRAFWVIAGGWILGVIGAAPSAIRQMNAGAGVTLPGLSAAISEVIITAAIALLPPLLAAAVVRRRRSRT